jgi:hypothetical protein
VLARPPVTMPGVVGGSAENPKDMNDFCFSWRAAEGPAIIGLPLLSSGRLLRMSPKKTKKKLCLVIVPDKVKTTKLKKVLITSMKLDKHLSTNNTHIF